MNQKTRILTILFLLTLLFTGIYLLLRPSKMPLIASVSMLNVGQGDSFLIQAADGRQLLIDGGKDEKVLTELAKVMPVGDRSIDVVIATHPDADHIGGLPLVLDRYKVSLFLTSDVLTDTDSFTALYQTLQKRRVPAYYVRRGMTLSLSDNPPATFSILFPDRSTKGWETNAASVVGRLDIGKRSVLFTGDSPSSVERFLSLADPKGVDVDILKLGHHGSKTATSAEYLSTTSPALALISAGVGNRYGHPAPEVVNRLKTFGVPFVSTQDVGTYTFTTDGEKWYRK